jgi:hypothetical protein
VSGHAFVGAVPLFTIAKMSDSCLVKAGFYTLGTAAGISRLHDNADYLSQVGLGWWIAYLSVCAVDGTEQQKRQWQLAPTIINGSPGVMMMHQW